MNSKVLFENKNLYDVLKNKFDNYMSKLSLNRNRKKGFLIWITGLAGSGKTSLANEIYSFIEKKYGQTVVLSGDDLRKEFNFKKFDKKSRLKYAMHYSSFCKKITDKKINLIFATVSLFNKVRLWNKKNIENYLEIYIEADISKLLKKKNKPFYRNNKNKNIVGKGILPEFPTKPHIKIKNNFKSIKILKTNLINRIRLIK